MNSISKITGRYSLLLIFGIGLSFSIGSTHVDAREVSAPGDVLTVQIDPNTEQLDQVSEPIGDATEQPEVEPTDSLDAVSETDDQVSEEVGDDIAPTEPLDEDSETDDQASEEVGQDSETTEQATEVLPPGSFGEEYPLEYQAPAQEEMPLGDREAEGRGLGE
jgi:hypothetical protein